MNPFFQALDQGYDSEQILGYLSKAIPKIGSSISKAKKMGYTAKQVIGYLSKTMTHQDLQGKSESQIHSENRNKDAELARRGLSIAATAVAAPIAASAASSALSRALPNSLKNLSTGIASQAVGLNPPPAETSIDKDLGEANPSKSSLASTSQMNPVISRSQDISQQPPVNQVDGNIPQVAQPVQPEGIPNELQKQELIKKEQPTTIKELLKQKDPFGKSSLVGTSQGIGEIKEIRNGKALININGKKHVIDEDELEQEPEELRELDLEGPVSDYLSRIPEGQKSSVIDVSLYDPTTQELQVRFPNGDQWVYGPIPEEIFEKINSMTGIPVSSGESKLRGTIWEKGEANSAGADFYKLIKKFVREGVVKERKLKTGIDLFKGFTRVKKRK